LSGGQWRSGEVKTLGGLTVVEKSISKPLPVRTLKTMGPGESHAQ